MYYGMLDVSRTIAAAVAEVGASQHDLSDPIAVERNSKQVMKRQVFDLLVIGLLMGLAAASAQGQSVIAKANVPFAFTIDDARLLAREYAIASGAADVAPELLVSLDGEGRVREATMAARMEPGSNRAERLVFQRYGPRQVLAESWPVAGESGRKATETR